MQPFGKWQMTSNRGWEHVTFEALRLIDATRQVQYQVHVEGQSWCRIGTCASPTEYTKADDFSIRLACVLVSVPGCVELLRLLDVWLACQEGFICTLTSPPHQTAVIQIDDQKDDLPVVRDKSYFTFFYMDGPCRVELCFLVDQSCIRIARDGLKEILQHCNVKAT